MNFHASKSSALPNPLISQTRRIEGGGFFALQNFLPLQNFGDEMKSREAVFSALQNFGDEMKLREAVSQPFQTLEMR